jgi:hypothetical protein
MDVPFFYFMRLGMRLILMVLLFGGLVGAGFASPVDGGPVQPGPSRIWEGEWQSANYRSVGGKLHTEIPEDIPVGRKFPVTVEIYYRPESYYKSGKTVPVEFAGMLSRNGRVTGGGETGNDPNGVDTLTLRGRPAWSFHIIEFKATVDQVGGMISGTYQTKWPSDQGSFVLRVAENPRKE